MVENTIYSAPPLRAALSLFSLIGPRLAHAGTDSKIDRSHLSCFDNVLNNGLVFVDVYMWRSDLNLNYIYIYIYVVRFEFELFFLLENPL